MVVIMVARWQQVFSSSRVGSARAQVFRFMFTIEPWRVLGPHISGGVRCVNTVRLHLSSATLLLGLLAHLLLLASRAASALVLPHRLFVPCPLLFPPSSRRRMSDSKALPLLPCSSTSAPSRKQLV